MRWAFAMVWLGCSYAPSRVTGDASADDAPNDGRPVDMSTAACQLGSNGNTTDRGKVGLSPGGGTIGTIKCDGDDRIVGLALDMSDNLADGQSRSAHGIKIACATVTVDLLGGHVGTITTKERVGNGGNGWTPSVFTPITQCPAGSIVSGLAVHGSASTNYFLDATMTCTQFDSAGNVAATNMLAIAGSLSDNNNPSGARCDAGEQLVEVTTNTGAGLDSVRLQCASTRCE